MKKILSMTALAATLAAPGLGFAQANNGYALSADGQNVRNASGECWRAGHWTPAMATLACDPDLVPKPAAAPAPAPAPAAPPPAAPMSEKVTFAADTFFDFDKSVLKPAGKSMLDDLVGKIGMMSLEVVIAVGHTDSVGSNQYNQKLGARRAAAVKAYLVSKGVAANRIYTESKGETDPIASNKTAEGRSKNRRVEVEVVGTRAKR
ncbi:MAG: OmpA family protein [Betaproteobacteria bacterium]|nr:OmpA family protein [Betaproteobacteria bacterium]